MKKYLLYGYDEYEEDWPLMFPDRASLDDYLFRNSKSITENASKIVVLEISIDATYELEITQPQLRKIKK